MKLSFTQKNASSFLAWGVSILIHASVILLILFSSGVFKFAENKNTEVLSISIEGDPNKAVGEFRGAYRKLTTQDSSQSLGENLTTSYTKVGDEKGTGAGGGTGFNVKETYIGNILRKIHTTKYYPLYARKTGLQGVVKLKFTVKKDGSIKNEIQKIKSSGSQILDDAGIKTITDAAPFAPFPKEIMDDEINFIVDLDFVL